MGILAETDNFGIMKSEKLKQFITLIVDGNVEGSYFTEDE